MHPTKKTASNIVLHAEINNHLLTTQFLDCLHNRIIESKFLDWGTKETENWAQVCRKKSFFFQTKEIELLEKSIGKIAKSIHKQHNTKFNIINVGFENGIFDHILTKEFFTYGHSSYFLVDITEEAIMKSIQENISSKIDRIEAYIIDYMDFMQFASLSNQIRKNNHAFHFASFLGNKLGYLKNFELLHRIKKGFLPGDYILFGARLKKEDSPAITAKYAQRIIETFSDPTFVHFAMTPLERIGITLSNGDIEVSYGPDQLYSELKTIEMFFCFQENKTIFYNNEEFHFLKGEKISILKTRIFSPETVCNILEMYGFHVMEKYTNTDKTVGLFLCSVTT